MATVYSLVCWGGRTGKTATANASTDRITINYNGLRSGMRIALSGTMPTGLVQGTLYYVKPFSIHEFELYSDAGLTTRVLFSTAGSSLVAKGAYFLNLSAPQLLRYGAVGAERAYSTISAALAGRAAASSLDQEVIEIGEGWDCYETVEIVGNLPAASTLLTTKVDGVWGGGFHNGTPRTGFVVVVFGTQEGISFNKYNHYCEGFSVKAGLAGTNQFLIVLNKELCGARKMIFEGNNVAGTNGAWLYRSLTTLEDCLSFNCGAGIKLIQSVRGFRIAGCTSTKNDYGIRFEGDSASDIGGYHYNNLYVGNAISNWGAGGVPTALEGSSNNAGLSGEAWILGTGTRVTVATTDFADFNGLNFRPASAASPQVDSGVAFYGIPPDDVGGAVRPNYNNGGAVAPDIGCYEFDHGYGPWPVTATLTLTGLVSGSDVVVLVAGTSTILTSVDANAGSSWVYTYSTVQNVDIGIIKPGYKVKYIRNYPLAASDISIPVEQQLDPSYS